MEEVSAAAQRIALRGTEYIPEEVDIERFGHLWAIDNREIKTYRSIRALIREYELKPDAQRPLCIAAFGSPGAGKSFAARQIARATWQGELEDVEVNLTQLSGQEAVKAKFEELRESIGDGRIPFVIWDEFDTPLDSVPFGWISHFIGPMCDEGKAHSIGRCIFLFTGGILDSCDAFKKASKREEYKPLKLPDFRRRLDGCIDVLSLNLRGDSSWRMTGPFCDGQYSYVA